MPAVAAGTLAGKVEKADLADRVAYIGTVVGMADMLSENLCSDYPR